MNPLLSICIATYNRAPYLKNILDNIVWQDWFSDEVEIVIYHDESSDNTEEIVTWFQEEYSNITYYKTEKRAWMIPSILNVAQMWKWKYIWLFSDDDLLKVWGLKKVIDTIKENDPDLLLNKYQPISKDTIWTIKPPSLINKTTNFIWIEELFQYFSWLQYSIDGFLMHCSLFCFKKEVFIGNLNSLIEQYGVSYKEILYNDYFAHIKIIYLPFWEERKITLLENDIVLLRAGNISWTFKFKTCTDYLDLIKKLKERYSIPMNTYKKMLYLYRYSVFTYIVIVHIQKYLPQKVYNRLVNIGKKIVKKIQIW